MADSFEDKIATAIAAELNDPLRSWNALFVLETTAAVRTLAPFYEAEDLATLKVAVVPLQIDDENAARGLRRFDYKFPVNLQKMVEWEDDTQMRALNYAAEQIHNWFAAVHELATLAGWVCIKAARPDVYNLPLLYADRTWETQIDVTVRGHRP